ncbi:MAG: carbon starvation protein A [Phycisphaeraceae bacterium]|nr:carbon starvation protein A [Phycisphaeraceae bacterium]
MSLLLLALIACVVLVVGYLGYGTLVSRFYRLDDRNTTPAVSRNDGVDFVPERPFALLAQHFSAIAAAGPIAGPILACMAFGWAPCLLWIIFGVVFIGAVHDFSALVASIRHGAGSIAQIAKENLGKRAGVAILWFIWLALLYVIIAFTQMTAGTFVGVAEEFEGLSTPFNKGGAVAASSVLYLGLALVLGIVQRLRPMPLWLVSIIFVPATLVCVWLGTLIDNVLVLSIEWWFAIILGYCLVASMLPLWLLQQPRGFLGGFVLYLALAIGIVGLIFGGYEIRQPAFSENTKAILDLGSVLRGGAEAPPMTMLVFPFLFVTIACGACSGFHGLICGGTTSRQISKESHCKPVAFGAMLLEGLVAVIALATIMIIAPADTKNQPPARIYGDGLAQFMTIFLGENARVFCVTLGAMAFSTFVFDTLDVSTRLGRYLLQELFNTPGRRAGFIAAGVTVAIPLLVLLTGDPRAYLAYWTLFGTSNQLLAALTLLGVTVWLRRNNKRIWFTFVPMLFVMAVTVSALLLQVWAGVRDASHGAWRLSSGAVNPAVVNGGVSIALLGLAAVFVREAALAWRRPSAPGAAPRV